MNMSTDQDIQPKHNQLWMDHFDRLTDDSYLLDAFAHGVFFTQHFLSRNRRHKLWNVHINSLATDDSKYAQWKEYPPMVTSYEPLNYGEARASYLVSKSYIEFERIVASRMFAFDERKLEYVYLMVMHAPNVVYKIGRSVNPASRLTSIQTAVPYPLEIVCTIPTYFSSSHETALHIEYTQKRLNGEWFELTDEDVAHIKSLAEAINE